MTSPHVVLTIVCIFGISVGQILFKTASGSSASSGILGMVAELMLNGYFLLALALYGSMTVLWVWILKSAPLTVAYPFYALSFIFVPTMSYLFLSEPITLKMVLGSLLIVGGIIVISQ